MSKNIYHFFVEGVGERAIINTLKTDFQCIQAEKVDVFNVIQNKLNKNMLKKLNITDGLAHPLYSSIAVMI